MAIVIPRILDVNLVKASATVLSASSAQQANPVRYLLDQLRSKVWRSDLGWTVVTGWNDRILFSSPGGGAGEEAFVAAGFYATGPELAVAIVAALEAADSAPVWACNYGVTSANKFTISADVNFDMLNGAALGSGRSIHRDLGYSDSDILGVTTTTATNASYQSRHYIACDFGSAQAITASVLLNDNLSASATLEVRSSGTSILAALLSSASATQTLADRGDYWSLYFGSQSHRYVGFVINDVQNTVGYAEAGIAYLGTYRSPTAYSANFGEGGSDLSIVELATEGANYGDQRPETRAWSLEWRNQTTAQVDAIWRVFRTAVPQGKCFFFDFDSAVPSIVYGFHEGPIPIVTADGGLTWRGAMAFREALP